MAAKGWQKRFEDPIEISGRKSLVTLKDAADYVTRLPKAEHESPQWQAAIEALIMAAEGRGPLMHARIGVMRHQGRHFAAIPSTRLPSPARYRGANGPQLGLVVSCARMR